MKSSPYFVLLSSLVLTTASWAEDSLPVETQTPPAEERVLRRTTAEDADFKLLMRQQRAAEQEAEAGKLLSQASTKKEAKRADFMFASNRQHPKFSLVSSYSYYADYTHWLAAIGLSGHTLDMEDGTRWEVMSGDAYRLNSWRLNDPIVVTPNYSWFASGDFYITNQNTNTYVRADLVVSPIAFGPYSHWIIGIDHNKGHVYLENGTTWIMSSGDYFVYRNWDVNDHIIMGYNDSFLSTYDRVLINFNMDSYVRAKQY